MRPLPDAPVFSRPEALAFGWTDAALVRAVRSGRLIRLRRGYFAEPNALDDPIVAARAAVRGTRGAVIRHRSAALLHGLPLVGKPPPVPQLTVPPRSTGDVAPGHLYRATLRPQDVTIVEDVPVTSVARTLVDLARSMWTEGAVAALDFALHERMVDSASLADVAELCRRWPGGRRIPIVFELSDGRAESPLESCSRLAVARAGLPRPELQCDLVTRHGDFLGRSDFYWPEFGVAGEADGRAKYVDRDVLVAEKIRQERMEEAGLFVVRWTWTDIREDAATWRRRVEKAFERGRARDRFGAGRGWTARTRERLPA